VNKGFAYPASRVDVGNAQGALFVLSALGMGGSERKVARILTALAARGTRGAICALGPPYTLTDSLPPRTRCWTLDRRSRVSLRTLLRLRRVLLEERPRTVIAVDLYALLYLSMALRLPGVAAAQRVALINTTDFVRRRDRLFMAGYAPLLRGCDLLVFGSFRQREAWMHRYRLEGVGNLVIHNGVDAAHFCRSALPSADLARPAGIPANRIVIGTVGRIAPEKNQSALVRALARLRGEGIEAHLLIVGDGPQREDLLAQARALNVLPHVQLVGEVSDIRPLLAAMNLFALPSTSVETFSNAALEAMAMSLPVVLSDIGGAREMVRQGCEGFVVPVGDDDALFHALRTLCTDAPLLASMGHAARERVEADFVFDRMVATYRAIVTGPAAAGRGDLLPCK